MLGGEVAWGGERNLSSVDSTFIPSARGLYVQFPSEMTNTNIHVVQP